MLSCPCGRFHVPSHLQVETVPVPAASCREGRAGASSRGPEGLTGRLVIRDGDRRRPTPFVVSLHPEACPFVGQTLSVECHGVLPDLLPASSGSVGFLDVEEQLYAHALFRTCRVAASGDEWQVFLGPPLDRREVSAEAIRDSLWQRFGVRASVRF
jgi:hypothetical protein